MPRKLVFKLPTPTEPEPEQNSGSGWGQTARNIVGTGLRVGSGIASGIVGAVPSPITTPLAGAIGAGGEALAEYTEGTPLDWKRIGAEGVISAVPMGKVYKAGQMGLNILRGAGLAEAGNMLRRKAQGRSVLPESGLEAALDVAGTAMGGFGGYAVGKHTAKVADKADEATSGILGLRDKITSVGEELPPLAPTSGKAYRWKAPTEADLKSDEGLQTSLNRFKKGDVLSPTEHQVLRTKIDTEQSKEGEISRIIGYDPSKDKRSIAEEEILEAQGRALREKELAKEKADWFKYLEGEEKNAQRVISARKVAEARKGRVPGATSVTEKATDDTGTTVSTKLLAPEEIKAAADKAAATTPAARIAQKAAEAAAAEDAKLQRVNELIKKEGLKEGQARANYGISAKTPEGGKKSFSQGYYKPDPDEIEGDIGGAITPLSDSPTPSAPTGGPKPTSNPKAAAFDAKVKAILDTTTPPVQPPAVVAPSKAGELFKRQPKEAAAQRLTPEVKQALAEMLDELETDPLMDVAADVAAKAPMLNRRHPLTRSVGKLAPFARKTSTRNDITNKQLRNAISQILESDDIHSNVAEGAVAEAERRLAGMADDLDFNPAALEGMGGERPSVPQDVIPGEPGVTPQGPSKSVPTASQTPKNAIPDEPPVPAPVKRGIGLPGGKFYVSAEEAEANPEIARLVAEYHGTGDPYGKRAAQAAIEKLRQAATEPAIPGLEGVRAVDVPTPKVAEEPPFSLTGEVADPGAAQGSLLTPPPMVAEPVAPSIMAGSVDDRVQAFLNQLPEGTEITDELRAAAQQAAEAGLQYGTLKAAENANPAELRTAGRIAQQARKAFDSLKQKFMSEAGGTPLSETPANAGVSGAKGISVKQLTDMLGYKNVKTVRRAYEAGEIPIEKIGNKVTFSPENVVTFLKARGMSDEHIQQAMSKIMDETGQITPGGLAILHHIALGGVGAAAGAAMDDENPLRGAALGAGVGFGVPAAATYLAKNPGALRKVSGGVRDSKIARGIQMIPNVMRASLLSDPIGIHYNATLGPYGSGLMGGLEDIFTGNVDEGMRVIKHQANPLKFITDQVKNFPAAARLIGRNERGELMMGEAPSIAEQGLAVPGTWMTAGDMTTRNNLKAAGISEDRARAITLTAEPWSTLGAGATDFSRKGVANKMLLPFVRTGANIFESGLERAPGIGFLMQMGKKKLTGSSDPIIAQLGQQSLGGLVAVGAYSLGESLDPETVQRYKLNKAIANFAGQYGLIAGAAFAAGQAKQLGNSQSNAVITSATRDLPLPTMDAPIDIAKSAMGALQGEPAHPTKTGPGKWLPRAFWSPAAELAYGIATGESEDTGGMIEDDFFNP